MKVRFMGALMALLPLAAPGSERPSGGDVHEVCTRQAAGLVAELRSRSDTPLTAREVAIAREASVDSCIATVERFGARGTLARVPVPAAAPAPGEPAKTSEASTAPAPAEDDEDQSIFDRLRRSLSKDNPGTERRRRDKLIYGQKRRGDED